MPTVRLQSLKGESRIDDCGKMFIPLGIHTPGLIRWAKTRFSGDHDDPIIGVIAESYRLKREVALAILTGEVDITVESDDVAFHWPSDDPFVKKVR
jgi:hypothetical protein